ncbi:MAG: phage holin family protein [Eggerthellaceae bacterium]|nr:phage holin family protein [Eggerthellaceae bacterium]
MNFILRWIACAIAVGLAVFLVPGISIIGGGWASVVFTALFLALINASIKPLLQALSLPISILTLGIFALIVNALMLELASWLASGIFGAGLNISSFASAFFASIIISIVSAWMNKKLGTD